MTAILEHDPPPISTVQRMMPPALEHVVKTCLTKDPDARWQAAGDVGRQLRLDRDGSASSLGVRAAPKRTLYERIGLVVVGLAVGALVTRIASSPPRESRTPQRFTITVPESDPLRGNVSISSDGQMLIYVGFRDGVHQLFRRPMGAFEATPVPGTENASAIAISPDGEWAAFGPRPTKVSLSAGAHVDLSSEFIGGQGTCGCRTTIS